MIRITIPLLLVALVRSAHLDEQQSGGSLPPKRSSGSSQNPLKRRYDQFMASASLPKTLLPTNTRGHIVRGKRLHKQKGCLPGILEAMPFTHLGTRHTLTQDQLASVPPLLIDIDSETVSPNDKMFTSCPVLPMPVHADLPRLYNGHNRLCLPLWIVYHQRSRSSHSTCQAGSLVTPT